MDKLCTDDLFWDHNLTWGNDRNYPEFTKCFQDTLLLWLPNIFIWLATPVYLLALRSIKDEPTPWNWKSISKLSVAVVQLSVRYLQWSVARASGETGNTKSFGLAFDSVTILLAMYFIVLERRKGFVTSGIQTIYWFLGVLCTTVLIFSDYVSKNYSPSAENTQLLRATFSLAMVQFVLTWFADVAPGKEKKGECKLQTTSFVQRLTFSWLSGFMGIGPKRRLEEEDVGKMMPSDQADNCIPKFEATWNREKERLLAKARANGEEKAQVNVGLLRVMLLNDWPVLLAANLLTLCEELSMHMKPIMLGCLISFIESEDQPAWKGYVYMSGFIITMVFEFVLGNYEIHLVVSVAMRVKNVLHALLFKKTMTMANKARSENTVGEIVNLLTDAGQVQWYFAFFQWHWQAPFNLVGSFIVLYLTVDYAVLSGLCVLLLVLPLNSYFAKCGHNSHLERMKIRDERVKLMTEILNGIKILKLYAWEMIFGEKISDFRRDELKVLSRQKNFDIIGSLTFRIAPVLMVVATFSTYVMFNESHMLSAATAFRCMATFGVLSHCFNAMPHTISHIARSHVSIKRLEKYLNSLDIDESNVTHEPSDNAITIENSTFTWDQKLGPCLKDINMKVPTGSLVAILGTVGSGKSSLLSAILGEMEKDKGTVNVLGNTAYVPQQAWIKNETLKDNILFGNKYREGVYNDIVEACALKRDLEILPGGDQTEIGEKGINLSGGQKQRVSIARSVYFNADTYLLDDPLSAVDTHVGKHIFDHVIGNEGLLRNKTRVLVTHGITWLPYVDTIFVMEKGKITESGSYKQLLDNGKAFAEFIKKYKTDGESSDDDEEDTYDKVPTERVDTPIDTDQVFEYSCNSENWKTYKNERTLLRMMSDSGYSSPAESKTESNKEDIGSMQKMLKRSISRAISHHDRTINESDSDDNDKLISDIVNQSEADKFSSDETQTLHRLKEPLLYNKFEENEKRIKKDAAKCKEAGKQTEEDELEDGKVKMKYLIPYFKAFGTVPAIITLICLLVFRICDIAVDLCIREWTGDVHLKNQTELASDSLERYERNIYYIKSYLVISAIFAASNLIVRGIIGYGVVKAARVIHQNMLTNILRGPMSFFDTTPVGRIVCRFSQDIEPLDGHISGQVEQLLNALCELLSVFVVIVMSMPMFIFMIIPVAYGYYEIQKHFIPIRRQLSRFDSKRRSPIASHFSECIYGTSTIRAFNMQQDFAKENARKVELLMECVYHNISADRWMNLRLSFLNMLSFAAAAVLALQGEEHLTAAVVGMAITYALQMNGSLSGIVRSGGEMEKSVVCIERVGQYMAKKQEAALHTDVMPSKSWPENGEVSIRSYDLRYRDGLPLVLQGVDMDVSPGEKIGIVGRTGAGKSSLTLGLFRLVEPAAGNITIDDHDISKLGLFDLRSSLTILPQEPVLFTGTLRINLDPLKEHTDEIIFRALEHAHLKDFVVSLPDKLEYECGEGGKNLSVGQRQLVCLARSLLRKSKVLVLDEATAAVDMHTDELIQNTIKDEFKECTVLTIAHRLNTIIDYDRILVLDHGKVKEFDSPKVLLENKNSEFYSMAKDAGLVK